MNHTKTLVFAFSCLILAACGDTESSPASAESTTQTIDGWVLRLTPLSAPLHAGSEDFRIELTEGEEPVEVDDIGVEAWMPMHGHGTMEPTVVAPVETGIWEATVVFSMPGEWELQVDAEDREFELPLTVNP